VNNFAATTGAHVTMAETYLPYQAINGTSVGWSYLTTLSTLASWLSTWSGTSDQMVIGVPMVTLDGSGSPENTLAQGAAGDENANFVAIAKNLVALGFGNAILRPGWEFDGNWYPWTVQSDTDAANFATYWQNIVTAMRSVPGADFKFVWSPTGFQPLSWNINDAYPGNAYVNYVSFDVYDWSWNSSIFTGGDPNNSATVAQSNAFFNEFLTDTEGLNWLASFALAHDKPIVIPEWDVTIRNDGHGLGDDPTFINNMYNWFISNHVAWVIYFTADVADNVSQGMDFTLTDGHFPNSLAAFEADFG
jgi:beta-mannanase